MLRCSFGYKRYGAVAFTKLSMGNLSWDRREGMWSFQVIGIGLAGWWGWEMDNIVGTDPLWLERCFITI